MATNKKNNLLKDTRPWGKYEVLHTEPGFQIKRIEINPSSRLSLQKHNKREEHWTVVAGEGIAVVNDEEIRARKGTRVHIPVGARHRMGNTGRTPLVFIEVQIGDYLGEDDIERFEDDYHRA